MYISTIVDDVGSCCMEKLQQDPEMAFSQITAPSNKANTIKQLVSLHCYEYMSTQTVHYFGTNLKDRHAYE